MDSISISVELPVQSWNLVLAALGERPFREIAEVVAAIKAQAEAQLSPPPAEEPSQAE